ncbi:hypothetical protein AMTRI_Chr09g35110 [Amborella trichopoda]
MATHPSLVPEIGPDGLAREAPVIAYTEKIIAEEQLQLRKYIEENYSKIRDVERELANLTLELKLTAGPKKAALEHLRKKIELSAERIHVAKQKEDQARKEWEAALKALKDEEANKQKLCDDLNHLVQESTSSQFTRLEELKRRLEALNPSRVSQCDLSDAKLIQAQSNIVASNAAPNQKTTESLARGPDTVDADGKDGDASGPNNLHQSQTAEGEVRGQKMRNVNLGRGKGNLILQKGRGPSGPGWTGAGFDVDGRA